MGIHRIWTQQRSHGWRWASIKKEIDVIAFNPNSVTTCASELWEFLPKDNKQISMYSEEDVQRYNEMIPSDLKITCKSFGIS